MTMEEKREGGRGVGIVEKPLYQRRLLAAQLTLGQGGSIDVLIG